LVSTTEFFSLFIGKNPLRSASDHVPSSGEYGGSEKTDSETWARIGLAFTSH